MIAAYIFLVGLIIGSFLNVCIHRLPQGESVVAPRSRCPKCQHQIAAYDNIPLLSYLILGGRCRYCKTPFSPRYFFVELIAGLLFLFAYHMNGLSVAFAKMSILSALLIVLVMTDWQDRILPDKITFTGMAFGAMFSLLTPVGDGASAWLIRFGHGFYLPASIISLCDGLLGALVGAGLLFGMGELYFRLRGVEGMGFGDVKMMAMVGLFLGPQLALLTILFGSLAGSVLGLFFIALFRKSSSYEFPFGSFLGLAAFVSAAWGKQFLDWYLRFFN